MIKVLFFARYRELLGVSELALESVPTGTTLDVLKDKLIAEHGESWREVLGADNLVQAINQAVVDGNAVISDGDELAFFPPVTGG